MCICEVSDFKMLHVEILVSNIVHTHTNTNTYIHMHTHTHTRKQTHTQKQPPPDTYCLKKETKGETKSERYRKKERERKRVNWLYMTPIKQHYAFTGLAAYKCPLLTMSSWLGLRSTPQPGPHRPNTSNAPYRDGEKAFEKYKESHYKTKRHQWPETPRPALSTNGRNNPEHNQQGSGNWMK